MHNIPGGDIAEGDEIVEYSPKYEHERSKGIKRFVVLIYKQKHRLNVSGKVIYLKCYKKIKLILYLSQHFKIFKYFPHSIY